MAPNPKAFAERINAILAGWLRLAPNTKFGGLTLAEFTALVASSVEPRAEIASAEQTIKESIVLRDTADVKNNVVVQQVVSSVKGDPKFGEDSPLYVSFGYVAKSQRETGLTRASNPESSDPAKAVA